jgi:PIN domain nuclease of toxin-antitoxin system
MVYVLDTHAVVWFLEGSSRLSAAAQSAMSDPASELVVPTIVLVEIQFLYAKKRATVDLAAVRSELISVRNAVVYPLDAQVVSVTPTSLNIHDAIIVATAIVYRDVLKQGVEIITKDHEIAPSGLIATLW